jgi:ABC-type multidrug transport system ATPase subunit
MSPSESSPASTALIEARGLEKSYEPRGGGAGFTLGPAAFAVAPGEVVAVLGRNGAGKSTLFELLTGNLEATRGEVALLGERLVPANAPLKRRLGYLPQDCQLPRWVSGLDMLRYAATLLELPEARARVDAALAYYDCASFARAPLATLSYGMQKRVGLALATLADPPVLILDEPHSGLDLAHLRALDAAIAARTRGTPRATIVSTHVAPYAAKLAHRAVVVAGGQLRELAGFAGAGEAARVALIEEAFFGAAAGRDP